MDNLRLGKSRTEYRLTASDSDVVEDFILPAAQTSGATTWSSTSAKVYATNNASYGNYYNWFAATAGTGTISMGADEDAGGSVCPLGWRLPSYVNGDYARLSSYYTGHGGMTNSFAQLRFSGQYDPTGNGVTQQGQYGAYYTSTSASLGNAWRYMLASTGGAYNDSSKDKAGGRTIRCVAN